MVGTLGTTITSKTVFGNKKIVFGTTNFSVGTPSGTITTGLKYLEQFFPVANSTGSADLANGANFYIGALPQNTGNIYLTSGTNNMSWYWMAIGR